VIPQTSLSPIGLAIAAVYPHPNTATASFGTNNYNGTDVLKDRADESIYKLDHQFFSWWRANVSYLHYASKEPGGNPNASIAGTGGVDYLLYRKVDAINWNNTFLPSPAMVVTVGYGFNRFPNNSLDSSAGFDQTTLGFPSSYVNQLQKKSFPVVNMTNFSSLGGANSGPSVFYSRSVVLGVSKYLGKHNLKSGFVFRSISVDFTDLSNGNGTFNFANDFVSPSDPLGKKAKTDLVNLLTGYASLVLPLPRLSTWQPMLPTTPAISRTTTALPAKLTLNLGLRYEWEAGLSERSNHYAVGFDQNATTRCRRPQALQPRAVSNSQVKMDIVAVIQSVGFGRDRGPTLLL